MPHKPSLTRRQFLALSAAGSVALPGSSLDAEAQVALPTEQEALSVIGALLWAERHYDVAALEELLAADFYRVNGDGSVVDRVQVLLSYRDPVRRRLVSAQHEEDRVQICGLGAVISVHKQSCVLRVWDLYGRRADGDLVLPHYLRPAEAGWAVAGRDATFLKHRIATLTGVDLGAWRQGVIAEV